MSEATIETPADVVLTDFSVVNDNARVEDESGYASRVSDLLKDATAAGLAAVNDAGAKTRLAWSRLAVRASILNQNGYPDWGGETSIYTMIVNRVESNALNAVPGMNEGTLKKIQDAVRTQMSRGITRQAVVRHIVQTESAFAKYADKVTDDALADFAAKPPVALQRRVIEHYQASKNLKKSNPYPPQGGTNPAAGNVGPTDTAVAAFKRTTKTVSEGGILPSITTEGIYAQLQGVGRQLHGPNVPEVENLPVVLANLGNIARLAGLIVKSRDGSGKITDAELKKLDELLEVPTDEDDAEAESPSDDAEADAAAVAAAEAEAKAKADAAK